MHSRLASTCFLLLCCLTQFGLTEEKFRTDENQNEKLPWFQLEDGKFPPEGSAHYFSGELIEVDHINRKGMLRVDRTDKQSRSHWDLPVDFELLPYGIVRYHNAFAELRDIPIGTHLHGLFYLKGKDSPGTRTIFHNRKSIEADFTRALQLEDDFSFYARQNQAWRVESVDLDTKKLIATSYSLTDEKPLSEKSLTFDLNSATRVWKGKEIAQLTDVAKGQIIQLNLTWATLYGPGRCIDLWLDSESQEIAAKRQMEVHRIYQKDHGVPGWIDAVDNPKRILTITMFGNVSDELLADFKPKTHATTVVAEPTLRSYDQINDRKGGSVEAVEKIAKQPGSAGIQIQCKVDLLLEGFRPRRIVRVFPNGWPVITIPSEEQLFPARD